MSSTPASSSSPGTVLDAGGPEPDGAAGPPALPAETCPLCGAPLPPEQEWCLNCGAAARTRMASSSNWKAPIIAVAVVATLALGVLAASLVALTGNFGSKPTATTVVTVTPAPSAPTPTTTTATPPASSPGTASGSLSTEPSVATHSGPPPVRTQWREIIVGTGAKAREGDTVTVNYVGALYNGGAQFDSSWGRGKPFTFALGTSQVIAGWNAVKGMKVGGRRELIVPAFAAYGAKGLATRPVAIPPNAALVFVVDLLAVSPTPSSTGPATPAKKG